MPLIELNLPVTATLNDKTHPASNNACTVFINIDHIQCFQPCTYIGYVVTEENWTSKEYLGTKVFIVSGKHGLDSIIVTELVDDVRKAFETAEAQSKGRLF